MSGCSTEKERHECPDVSIERFDLWEVADTGDLDELRATMQAIRSGWLWLSNS